ncbi:MAG: hypothetical protein ACXABY_32235, partial [Candidatus Thorarchaeota archaeon]
MNRKHKVCLMGATVALFMLLMSTASLGATVLVSMDTASNYDLDSQSTSIPAIAPNAPPGLVSYWQMNETGGVIVPDSFGPNRGTLRDGGRWTPGVSANGLDLYPSAFVDSGGDGSLSIQNLLTIEAWVYLDDTHGIRTIIQNGYTQTSKMYHFAVEDGFLYFDRFYGPA